VSTDKHQGLKKGPSARREQRKASSGERKKRPTTRTANVSLFFFYSFFLLFFLKWSSIWSTLTRRGVSGLFTSADSLPIQLAPVHGRKDPSNSRLDRSRADLFRAVAARSERGPGRSGSSGPGQSDQPQTRSRVGGIRLPGVGTERRRRPAARRGAAGGQQDRRRGGQKRGSRRTAGLGRATASGIQRATTGGNQDGRQPAERAATSRNRAGQPADGGDRDQ
jgi:hypothetical protein